MGCSRWCETAEFLGDDLTSAFWEFVSPSMEGHRMAVTEMSVVGIGFLGEVGREETKRVDDDSPAAGPKPSVN